LGAGAATTAVVAYLLYLSFPRTGPNPEAILHSLAGQTSPGKLTIDYPLDGTLFPPEIGSPAFRWTDGIPSSNLWLVSIEFADRQRRINASSPLPEWRPRPAIWREIQRRSLESPVVVTVIGFDRKEPTRALSAGHVTIRTSSDAVGAPLFYREVNLPFVDAVKDTSTIRWRFGSISSSQPPPIVLENLPVCGNCHSFSSDGRVLGMDIDYANDKGSYAIAPLRPSVTLDRNAIITWSDYRRDEGDATFGLLSQVSPDGRYVVSTVKDESVFVAKPGLDFSQLFFPVKGILCVYDRQTGAFRSLPGADDPNLVQSNPTWSPNGEYIVFAATKAHKLRRPGDQRKVLLSPGECREFLVEGKPFKFDLYRIPFNEGQGGPPEPIAGASCNGKSNFFPKYSPDGRWIVFCQAENYMLLQPDSELYIIPAAGGEPRRLRANTKRMNSWHSFSPNGKWLVFSGKPDSPYTRLYLTHIDEQGQSTPPVVLDRLTAPDRAANIPEFVNVAPSALRQIRERFIDDVSYARAAWECFKANDHEGAERHARKALALNPKNSDALHYLGLALFGRRQYDQAIRHLSEAARLVPDDGGIQVDLGAVLVAQNRLEEAVRHLRQGLERAPDSHEGYFNLGVAEFRQGNKAEALRCWLRVTELDPHNSTAQQNVAVLLEEQGRLGQALAHYRQAARLKPDDCLTQAKLGMTLCATGAIEEGLTQLSHAVSLEPANIAARLQLATTLARYQRHKEAIAQFLRVLQLNPRNTDALTGLAVNYAQTGQLDKALDYLEAAFQIARSAGNRQLAEQIARQIQQYRQQQPASQGNR